MVVNLPISKTLLIYTIPIEKESMMIRIILDNEFTMESCYPILTPCKRQKGA